MIIEGNKVIFEIDDKTKKVLVFLNDIDEENIDNAFNEWVKEELYKATSRLAESLNVDGDIKNYQKSHNNEICNRKVSFLANEPTKDIFLGSCHVDPIEKMRSSIQRWLLKKTGTCYLVIKYYKDIVDENRNWKVNINDMEKLYIKDYPEEESRSITKLKITIRQLCTETSSYGAMFKYDKETQCVEIQNELKNLIVSSDNWVL